MNKEAILKEIAKLENQIEAINESWTKSQSQYERVTQPIFESLNKLYADLSVIEDDYEVYDGVAEGAEIIELDEFIKAAKDGYLTDKDGFGFYITNNGETNIQVMPSWVLMGKVRDDMDEVAWFNQ